MKKVILPLIILSLLFVGVALAQDSELSSPGITPDSPFYFLDTLAEKISLLFTFGAEKKAKKAMQYADEKLAEVKVMAEKNKDKAIKKANQKYQEFLGLANQKAQEAKEKGNWKIDLKESSAQLRRDAKRLSNLMQLRTHLEIYYDQHGNYPVLTDTSEDGEFLKVLRNFVGNLLDPLHPEYFYEYEGTRDSYTLKCYCEIEGGGCDMEDGIKDHTFSFAFPK